MSVVAPSVSPVFPVRVDNAEKIEWNINDPNIRQTERCRPHNQYKLIAQPAKPTLHEGNSKSAREAFHSLLQ